MKRIICLILASVLMLSTMLAFASCGSKTSKIEEGYMYVEKPIKEKLYDPDSLVVKSAEGVYAEDDNMIYYKVNYNAKNRLGGYVGYDDYYYEYNMDTKEADIITVLLTYDIHISMYKIQEQGKELDTKYFYKKIK